MTTILDISGQQPPLLPPPLSYIIFSAPPPSLLPHSKASFLHEKDSSSNSEKGGGSHYDLILIFFCRYFCPIGFLSEFKCSCFSSRYKLLYKIIFQKYLYRLTIFRKFVGRFTWNWFCWMFCLKRCYWTIRLAKTSPRYNISQTGLWFVNKCVCFLLHMKYGNNYQGLFWEIHYQKII